MISRLLAVTAVALTLAAGAAATHSRTTAQALPTIGVLIPGSSLAGVHIGDTQAKVLAQWGHNYRICPKNVCKGTDTVWIYTYPRGEPLGGAVRFDKTNAKATAVFTFGSPPGWKTQQGLKIGQQVDRVTTLYGENLAWSVCIGYGAMSMRTSTTVTSIYMTGSAVYGFALTKPGTPICQ